MYSKIWVVILCFSLTSFSLIGCGGGKNVDVAGEPALTPNKMWTLAILPFDTVGEAKISGDEVMNLLIAELIDLEGYKIIDRQSLQEVLNQLGFTWSDLSDSGNQKKVGGILGAKLLCAGNVNRKLKLATARVNYAETGEMLLAVKSSGKKDVENVGLLAQELRKGLTSQRVVSFLDGISGETVETVIPPQVVEVKGYGPIIDGDIATAKEMALKDAYSKAIEQGCGIKLVRQTQVENFQLVRDQILTESVGYITAYEILDEDPEGELGYEVTVSANVSKEPIEDLDKLKLMVQYLLSEPKIAVLVEGEANGEELKKGKAGVVAGQIALRLQQGGFSVVDNEAVEEKKAQLLETLGEEDAAKLGNLLNASVTVKANLVSEITTRIEEIDGQKLNFPNLVATTTGVFKIIMADTAEVVGMFSHEDIPPKSNIGSGTTEDAAIGESIDNFIAASAVKLAWELASKLGDPITVRLELKDVTLEQAQKFEEQLKGLPEHIVFSAQMQIFDSNTAHYQIETYTKIQDLQQKLVDKIDPEALEAEKLVAVKIDTGAITMALAK